MAANFSLTESYLSGPSQTFKSWNNGAERFFRMFDFLQSVSQIGQLCCELNGKAVAAGRFKVVSNHVGIIDTGVGASRFLCAWDKVFTGQMIWETKTVIVKEKVTIAGADGKEKPQIKRTKKVTMTNERRDLLDIILDISILIARTLSPLNLLHKLKALDLGKHAKNMGHVVIGAFGFVIAINLVQCIRGVYDATQENLREKVAWATSAVFDFIAYPFQIGFIRGGVVVTTIGLSFRILSALGYLFVDIAYSRESVVQDR